MSPEANFLKPNSKRREMLIRTAAAFSFGVAALASDTDTAYASEDVFNPQEHVLLLEGVPAYTSEVYLFSPQPEGPVLPDTQTELLSRGPDIENSVLREAVRLETEEQKRLEVERLRTVRATGSTQFYWDNDPACMARPDRFDWKSYALAAGFPAYVVNSVEMENLINLESRGDLCAVNDSSGATCWIQQHEGGPQFLEPTTCMSIGYAKWDDGNGVQGDGIGSFQRHWYNHH